MGLENKFAVHEHWHSMDDIEAHFKEKHFTDFAEELQQYLAGPSALSIGKYHSVSRRVNGFVPDLRLLIRALF